MTRARKGTITAAVVETKAVGTAAESAPVRKPAKATKTMAGRLKVREDEDAWTVAELTEIFDELNEQHERVAANLAEREAEFAGLMRDSGDGAGQDTADVGATNFERDHEINTMNTERAILAAVEKVLDKVSDNTFGVCESCGEPIGKMRVMAFPRATLCMSCKQREERR